jgi:hypothetical protein
VRGTALFGARILTLLDEIAARSPGTYQEKGTARKHEKGGSKKKYLNDIPKLHKAAPQNIDTLS